MKTSYYLTPDLRQKLVSLNIRDAEGRYHPRENDDQWKIIEQDPSKGEPRCKLGKFRGLMASNWNVPEQFAFISEVQDYTRL